MGDLRYESMIQYRQIHGVMAKSRDSESRCRGEKGSRIENLEASERDFREWYRKLRSRPVSEQSYPFFLPYGVDHECQEASEGLWCTSGDSPASRLDALVP